MNRSFGNSFLLVIIFELLLSLFLLLLEDSILKMFGVTETAYEYTFAYYRIVALGCLLQGLIQVFCDFVRVSGQPVLGMCVTGIGAVTNILLDAVFVAFLSRGVTGAAWATVIGQIFSALCGFAFWIAQMAMGVISLVYNSQLGKYSGDTAISVYAVIASIMTFVIMPASDALALALSILFVISEQHQLYRSEAAWSGQGNRETVSA